MAFLWRILSEVGIYVICPYDDQVDGVEAGQKHSVPQPLDPIPADLAGRCRTEVVRRFAVGLHADFGIQAVDFTRDVESILKEKPLNLTNHRPVSKKYSGHMDSLQEAKILERLSGQGGVQYLNGYFSVPKDAEYDRSILNAKKLNRYFSTPAPVNLQPITEVFVLVTALMMTVALTGRILAFVCDLRHWFHQIPISGKLSQLFGIHIEEQYYRWRTLPMGWSWSPRICQCIAWTLILWAPDASSNIDGLKQARVEARSATDPPRFAWMRDDQGQKIGFVTLTYDNLMIFVTDPVVGVALKKKLWANFKLAHVLVKESSVRVAANGWDPPLELSKSTTVHPLVISNSSGADSFGVCHLGVQYALKVIGDEWRILWRHEVRRTQKWGQLLEGLRSSATRRFVAKICGVIIWHYTVIQRALCHATRLIDILRLVATSDKSQWDREVSLSVENSSYLRVELERAILNEWTIGTVAREPVKRLIIFSDASKLRMGGILCDEAGAVLDVWPRRFRNGFEKAHIYLKELGAVIWLIFAYVEAEDMRDTHITIVIDNSAAFFSLMHLYSSNRVACRWLQRLDTLCKERRIELEYVLVGTDDNPADTPSRGENRVDPGRLRRGLLAVRCHREGRRFASAPGKKVENVLSGLRHACGAQVGHGSARSETPGATEMHNEEKLDELFLHLVDVDENFVEPEWPESKRARDSTE